MEEIDCWAAQWCSLARRTHNTQLKGAAPWSNTTSNRSLYGNTHEIMRVMHIIVLELASNESALFYPLSACVWMWMWVCKSSAQSQAIETKRYEITKRARQKKPAIIHSSIGIRKITRTKLYKRITEMCTKTIRSVYKLATHTEKSYPEITYHGELSRDVYLAFSKFIHQFGQPVDTLCSVV